MGGLARGAREGRPKHVPKTEGKNGPEDEGRERPWKLRKSGGGPEDDCEDDQMKDVLAFEKQEPFQTDRIRR